MPASICDLVPPLWPASPLLRPTRGQLGAHRQAPAPVAVAVAVAVAVMLCMPTCWKWTVVLWRLCRQNKRGANRPCRWPAQRRHPPGVGTGPTTLTTTVQWDPALLMMKMRRGRKGRVQMMC